jgi:large subunit ribosomal protein L21
MYAIVEIAGQQFKVETGKEIFVHRLEAEQDSIVEFDSVLLVENNDKFLIGEPVVENYIVEGKVLSQVKGDKVIVFKKKRKKGYRVTRGHRQNFSKIEIIGIGEKGTFARKESVRKERVKPVAVAEVTEEPAVEKAAPKKRAAAKKPAVKEAEAAPKTKKTAEKKTAEKKPTVKKASKKKE